MTHSNTTICESCGCEFPNGDVKFNGRVIYSQRNCDDCCLKWKQEELDRPQRERKELSLARFKLMIPPIYHETDLNKLSGILRSCYEKGVKSPLGLGIVGRAGAGKTRAAVMILKKAQDAGQDTFYVAATDLALHSANQFAESPTIKDIAISTLKLCKTSDLLMIDDLGKGRMTDRAESTLYDILEYRTSRMLPVIWTSNSDAKGMRLMFSSDRGDAIIRRLTEFCDIIKI